MKGIEKGYERRGRKGEVKRKGGRWERKREGGRERKMRVTEGEKYVWKM